LRNEKKRCSSSLFDAIPIYIYVNKNESATEKISSKLLTCWIVKEKKKQSGKWSAELCGQKILRQNSRVANLEFRSVKKCVF
jgi:hypothetical protein